MPGDNNKMDRSLRQDLVELFLYIFLLIVFIYFSSPLLKSLFLGFIILKFYISSKNRDYFWVLIALILVDYPCNLFWHTTDSIFKFSVIKLSFLQTFSIAAIFKIIFRKLGYSKFPSLLKKPGVIYIIYLLFLMVYGVLIGISGGGKTGYRYLWYYFRLLTIFPLFYTIPKLISGEKVLLRFAQLLFFLAILNFAGQIYTIIFKQNIHFLLGGSIPENWDSSIYYSQAELVRPAFGAYISLFSFFLSLYFYFSSNSQFNKRYLIVITITTLLSVVVTVSRGWILAYIFVLAMILLVPVKGKHTFAMVLRFAILGCFVILIILNSSVLKRHFYDTAKRLETMEAILNGDPTAGGTNSRLTSRNRPVMAKFYQSPIIGWGLSRVGMDTWDGHVGNQSALMIGGVVGYLIILYFLFYISKQFYKRSSALISNSVANKIVIFFILALFIIHSSSAQIFGFYLYAHSETNTLTLSIFLSMLAIMYNVSDSNRSNYNSVGSI